MTTINRRHPARIARVVVGAAASLAFSGTLAGFLLVPQQTSPTLSETSPGQNADVPPDSRPAEPSPAPVPAVDPRNTPADVPPTPAPAVPAPAPDIAPPNTPVDATTGGSGG